MVSTSLVRSRPCHRRRARPSLPSETAKAVEPRTYDRPTTPPEQIAVVSTTPDDGKPARKGWWQRRFTGE